MDLKIYQTNTTTELVARKLRRTHIMLGVVNSIIWLFGLFILSRFAFSSSSIFKNVDSSIRIFTPILFFIYLLMFPLLASICYQGFDGKVKLLVNENGIGYSTNLLIKCNNNPYKWFLSIQNATINTDGIGYEQWFYNWKEISSYQFIITKNKFGFRVYQLQLSLVNQTENVLIQIGQMDLSFNHIQDGIAYFTDKAKVRNLGISQRERATNNNDSIKETVKNVNSTVNKNREVSVLNDAPLIVRKKKPFKLLIWCIYLLGFITGKVLIYNTLVEDFGVSSVISWVVFIVLYISFYIYLKWYFNRVLFIINKEGIEYFAIKNSHWSNPFKDVYKAYKHKNIQLPAKEFYAKTKSKMYLWKELESFEFTACSKRVTLIKPAKNGGTRCEIKEVVGNLLILSKVGGSKYYIGVSENRYNNSLEQIMTKVKDVTKGSDIKDLGFSRQ